MLNIVILEDQAEQAERLTRMLEKYASSHSDFAYTLKRYERSIPMLTEYKCDADILFLDIQVPDMLGMEAAKKIRAMDNKVMIIFIMDSLRGDALALFNMPGDFAKGLQNALGDANQNAQADKNKCIGCGYCFQVCPTGALHVDAGGILAKPFENAGK